MRLHSNLVCILKRMNALASSGLPKSPEKNTEIKWMITEFFPWLRFINVNKEGLQQCANHWLHSGTERPD